jgi:hypothetical protein
VPLLHFLPEFAKDSDPAFSASQPFPLVPLNLVINDAAFFLTDALGKKPYPYLYINYIGWVPVLLAVLALRSQVSRRVVAFLFFFSFLALWLASAEPLRWLIGYVGRDLAFQLGGLRYISVAAGLAVPALVAMSAIGLDTLLQTRWARIGLQISVGSSKPLSLSFASQWLLVLPLALSLVSVRDLTSQYLRPIRAPEVRPILEALRTPDLQWVAAPFGQEFYNEPAARMNLKQTLGWQPWAWKNRPNPEPAMEAVTSGPPGPPGMVLLHTVYGVQIYGADGREYAVVTAGDGTRVVCRATGRGGDIDVVCPNTTGGILVVKENSWSGWQASVDGRPATLDSGRWLSISVPPGSHVIQFPYRPWDVVLGLVLFLAGIVLAIVLVLKPDGPKSVQ